MQLFIDDGVIDRGHRKTILSSDVKVVGIATCTHKVYGHMAVLVYAGSFEINEAGKKKIIERITVPKGASALTAQ